MQPIAAPFRPGSQWSQPPVGRFDARDHQERPLMSVLTPQVPAVAPAAAGPKKLGWRQYSGYAAGDAANNLAFTMAGSFLLLYYTNVVGLEAAPLGTMFLLVRFWDALA